MPYIPRPLENPVRSLQGVKVLLDDALTSDRTIEQLHHYIKRTKIDLITVSAREHQRIQDVIEIDNAVEIMMAEHDAVLKYLKDN